MVIGGQAVLVHGRPRFTGDIDITLGVDIDHLKRLRVIAETLSLQPLRKDVEKFTKQTNVFPVVHTTTNIKVDFIFSFSDYERQAIQRAHPIEVGETMVHFASAEDTIIHKLIAGRPIDIRDAKSITNIQPSINRRYVLKWLKKYSELVARDLEKEYREIEKQIVRSKGK